MYISFSASPATFFTAPKKHKWVSENCTTFSGSWKLDNLNGSEAAVREPSWWFEYFPWKNNRVERFFLLCKVTWTINCFVISVFIVHKLVYQLAAFQSLIARFMGPTWGSSGADRSQVGPMLAPWTLLSGMCWTSVSNIVHWKNVHQLSLHCVAIAHSVFKQGSQVLTWSIPHNIY